MTDTQTNKLTKEKHMETPPYQLQFSVEFITPDQAALWLDSLNVFNRPRKKRLVDRMARDIKSGAFKLNGEPIIFALENGQLLDGQNRLAATVAAGTPIWSVVVRGVPKMCFDTIDGGAPRSLADHLAIAGSENSRELQAALKVAVSMEACGYPDSNYGPTVTECEEFLDANPILKKHVQRVKQAGKLLIPPGLATGVLFHLNNVDTGLASQWLEALIRDAASKEVLISQRPFQLMRDRLLQNLDSRKKLRKIDLWAVIVAPWNAVISGQEMKRILLPKTGTPIPRLVRTKDAEPTKQEIPAMEAV